MYTLLGEELEVGGLPSGSRSVLPTEDGVSARLRLLSRAEGKIDEERVHVQDDETVLSGFDRGATASQRRGQ